MVSINESGTYSVSDEVAPGIYRLWGYAARLDADRRVISSQLIGERGSGLLIIEPTDSYIEVKGEMITVEAFRMSIDPIAVGYTEGMYLVGFDIEPGRYQVQPKDGHSFWARLDDTLDIIDSDFSGESTTVTVEDGDFALKFKGMLERLP